MPPQSTNPTTEQWLIYTRVSTDKQEIDGTSLDSQLAASRRYCQEHEYEVLGEYQDVFSGAKYRERPGLTELRARLRSGDVDGVLCYSLERLSRDQVHIAVLADEIEHHGARLELVTEEFENSAAGKFLRSAKAFAGEVERERISDRVIRGRRSRAELGKFIPNNTPPFGYRWPDADDKQQRREDGGSYPDEDRAWLVEDETNGPILRQMFHDAAHGGTLRGIALQLTDDGIPTPRQHITGNPVWSHASVRVILKNRIYLGEATSHGDICLPDDVAPALIDPATFEIVQRRLSVNRQRSKRNAKYADDVALLRGGFAICGLCGATLTVKRGNPRDYDYRCPTSGYNQCRHHGIRTHILDEGLWGQVRAFFMSDDALEEGGEGLGAVVDPTDELASIERTLSSTQQRHANLARRITLTDDEDTAAVLIAELDRLSERRRSLEADQEIVSRQVEQSEQTRQVLAGLDIWRRQVGATLDDYTTKERRELLDLMGLTVKLWPTDREPRWLATSELIPPIVLSAVKSTSMV